MGAGVGVVGEGLVVSLGALVPVAPPEGLVPVSETVDEGAAAVTAGDGVIAVVLSLPLCI